MELFPNLEITCGLDNPIIFQSESLEISKCIHHEHVLHFAISRKRKLLTIVIQSLSSKLIWHHAVLLRSLVLFVGELTK